MGFSIKFAIKLLKEGKTITRPQQPNFYRLSRSTKTVWLLKGYTRGPQRVWKNTGFGLRLFKKAYKDSQFELSGD